jgi:hypothetical protein
MESGLNFNQLNCEFESRHPCQSYGRMLNVTTSFEWLVVTLVYLSPCLWVVAQLVEHRTVTAAREGSTPFDPPKFLARNCGREVRHLIVDQVDDGSSPFSSAMRQ